jgi:hypothetical protein
VEEAIEDHELLQAFRSDLAAPRAVMYWLADKGSSGVVCS